MWTAPKNDETVMRALREQNRGNYTGAEHLFREAGNQVRNPDEKQALWDAANKAHQLGQQD